MSPGCCRLCQRERSLQESHLVPKFVSNMIKGDANGRLRRPEQPDIPFQDGIKGKMLCFECEQRFSRWERAASDFVRLCQDDTGPYKYGDYLVPFVLSVAWRVLVGQMDAGVGSSWPAKVEPAIERAEVEWRNSILQEDFRPLNGRIHALVIGSSGTPSMAMQREMPANWNRYLDVSVDATVATTIDPNVPSSSQSAIAYVKMGRLATFTVIRTPSFRRWKGSAVHWRGLLMDVHDEVPPPLLAFMADRARGFENRLKQMSPVQRARIGERVLRGTAEGRMPRALSALERDLEMFGYDEVFEGRRTRD